MFCVPPRILGLRVMQTPIHLIFHICPLTPHFHQSSTGRALHKVVCNLSFFPSGSYPKTWPSKPPGIPISTSREARAHGTTKIEDAPPASVTSTLLKICAILASPSSRSLGTARILVWKIPARNDLRSINPSQFLLHD